MCLPKKLLVTLGINNELSKRTKNYYKNILIKENLYILYYTQNINSLGLKKKEKKNISSLGCIRQQFLSHINSVLLYP